ncbi:hypothetical protein [Lactobacillus delbrueckii]|uniref:hypothetical protein n=1 Tax=Lactobacillus delbrueckii TaxID=1584 RepID=UPI0037CBA713
MTKKSTKKTTPKKRTTVKKTVKKVTPASANVTFYLQVQSTTSASSPETAPDTTSGASY